MLELLKGLAVAILMVPVVMAIILGLIWGLGEVFNVISKIGHRKKDQPVRTINCCHARHLPGVRFYLPLSFFPLPIN